MPSISRNWMSVWRNYHMTNGGVYRPLVLTDPQYPVPPDTDVSAIQSPAPHTIRETASINCSDMAGKSGVEQFALTGELLQGYLGKLMSSQGELIPKRYPLDCVPIGRGWSFSSLVGAHDTMIDMTGLSGVAMAQFADLRPDCAFPRDKVALALGGTRLRELTSWAQQTQNLSIITSGTHLGLTLAGGIATGSHGSRLGYGAIQNMVIGIHLVTAHDKSVWIERASKPVLNDKAIARFSSQPAIRDDGIFEDVLVHLGGMGIVNGLALELVEDKGYAVLPKIHMVDADWLGKMALGHFRSLAASLGRNEDPAFYELTIDPWHWNANEAIHTMYFEARPNAPFEEFELKDRTLADMLDSVWSSWMFELRPELVTPEALATPGTEMFATARDSGGDPPQIPPIFDLYKANLLARPDIENPPQNARWNQIHGDEITGGYPGSLFNASFAIQRENMARAIPLLCQAVHDLPPTFLFTMRFVSGAHGTLAFTRFDECVVIEIDGLGPNTPYLGNAFGGIIVEGAQRVRGCLDENGIAYSMHWGKLGGLDAAKIEADFGPSTDQNSKLSRWRRTRSSLLSERMQALFWNQGLVDYGLIKPTTLDNLPGYLDPTPPSDLPLEV